MHASAIVVGGPHLGALPQVPCLKFHASSSKPMGLIRDSAGGLQAVRSGLSVELVGSCELAGSCWWAHAVGELRASRRRVCSDLATQVAPARTRSGVWCHKIQHPKHPSVTDATQETGFSHLFEWCGPVCCSAVCVAEQCASQSSVRCRAVCVAEQCASQSSNRPARGLAARRLPCQHGHIARHGTIASIEMASAVRGLT